MHYPSEIPGTGRWEKGFLVLARSLSREFQPGEVGVILEVKAVGSANYVSMIFERGGFVTVPLEQAVLDMALLHQHDQSVTDLTYEPLSSYQVEDDFYGGLFAEAFALARSVCAIDRAKRTSSAHSVRASWTLGGKPGVQDD